MSNAIFPVLVGLGWDVVRRPMHKSIVQEAVSGKETRIGLRPYPRYRYTLRYDMLRDSVANPELKTLMAFFNARLGRADSFLYNDPYDNSVTDQPLGIGDGVETEFQLIRTMTGSGGVSFVEPVIAPNTITNIKIDSVVVDPADYTVDTDTGLVTFDTAPGNLLAITATFTYWWRCRFEDDELDFNQFQSALWSQDGLNFITLFSE